MEVDGGPPIYAPVPPKRTARATFSSQVRGRGGFGSSVSRRLFNSGSLSFRSNALLGRLYTDVVRILLSTPSSFLVMLLRNPV